MDAGVIPVKRLDRAKSRMAPRLDEAARRSLAEALLEDALALCRACSFLSWIIVSDDDRVLQRARSEGLEAVRDEGRGLNAAIGLAARALAERGADSMTVIPCDVPLAWRGDVEDLVDTGSTSDVVVVPSDGDGGTNGLYLHPPGLLEPRFGPDSLRAHVNEAERRSLRCSILALPRLGLDIDTMDDVDQLLSVDRTGADHTIEMLRRLGT